MLCPITGAQKVGIRGLYYSMNKITYVLKEEGRFEFH